ncbi:MAG TPA: hypothetical protein VGG70_05760, partial [Candidatus Cybelea sp.]
MSATTTRAVQSLLSETDRAELRDLFGDRVSFDEPLARYTSWKIGGPADALATVSTQSELANLLRFCLRLRM